MAQGSEVRTDMALAAELSVAHLQVSSLSRGLRPLWAPALMCTCPHAGTCTHLHNQNDKNKSVEQNKNIKIVMKTLHQPIEKR